MAFQFVGKKFLVTGAGKGFGRAITLSLANAGGKVYALSKTQATLDTLVKEHRNIIPITQDLKDWDGTREKLEQLEVLDGLVNNAARLPEFIPSIDLSKNELENFMQNNVFSAINCTQVIAKKMMECGKSGSIVNISSVLGGFAIKKCMGYDISKAAIVMVTKQFALELGRNNIRVNSVNPTLITTEGVQDFLDAGNYAFPQIFRERTPLARDAKVEDVVGPVLFLLSESSALVTGTTNYVDGGLACNLTVKDT